MGSLLGKLFVWLGRSPIGQAAFTLICEKVYSFFQQSIARERERRKMIEETKKSMEALKNAKTKEEVDAATDDALDGF